MKYLMMSAAALSLSACITAPDLPGSRDLVAAVGAETNVDILSDRDRARRIAELKDAPLSEAAALELSLLNNPAWRADYQMLKAAEGRYLDAAAIANPVLSGRIFSPEDEDITNIAYGLHYPILDLIFMEQRRDIAGADLDMAEATTRSAFVSRAMTVRESWTKAVAARQFLGLMDQARRATDASLATAQALYDAGNIPKIQLDRERMMQAEVTQLFNEAETAAELARIKLGAMMGVSADAIETLNLPSRLPPTSLPADMDAEALTSGNLELAEMDAAMTRLARQSGIEDITTLIGDAEIELERERDDGEWERGAGLSMSVPIFNTGAGRRAANRAELEAMALMRAARKLEIHSDISALIRQARQQERTVEYHRATRLPIVNDLLRGTQADYNAMQVGVFDLLDAKKAQLAAGQDYIMALKTSRILAAQLQAVEAGGSPGVMTAPLPDANTLTQTDDGGH